MEQATNLFQKGLQMDNHPMTLGNDTLSNALNATFITMNGNEIILLNDMGNRHITNLPSGYEPVGIKEYGGIIYIASYNPLTGKGQIGSFPSPLDLDFENGVGLSPSLEELLSDKKFKMLRLSKNSLRPGDKFDIIEDKNNMSDIVNYITELRETKNKEYTLSVGVLNSQNEFVDITSSLIGYESEEKSEEKKLFFIRLYLSISDITEYKNIYSNKLIGPLYIKSVLNTIENFQCSVNINKLTQINNSKTATLNVSIKFNYNCPIVNDNNYLLVGIKINDEKKKINLEVNDEDLYKNYDEINNTYTFYKNYKIEEVEVKTDTLNYEIYPLYKYLTKNDDKLTIAIGNLTSQTETGSFDISNSDKKVEVDTWQFKYVNKQAYILFKLKASGYNDEILYSNIKFDFKNILEQTTFTYIHSTESSWTNEERGSFNFPLSYSNNFNPNKMYEVTISVETNNTYLEIDDKRWFLSTSLFNDYYGSTTIQDYHLVYLKQNNLTEDEENFKKLFIVNYITKGSVELGVPFKEGSSSEEGVPFKMEKENFEIRTMSRESVQSGVYVTWFSIKLDSNKYPDYLEISADNFDGTLSFETSQPEIIKNGTIDETIDDIITVDEINISTGLYKFIKCKFKLKLSCKFKFRNSSNDISFSNILTSLDEIYKEQIENFTDRLCINYINGYNYPVIERQNEDSTTKDVETIDNWVNNSTKIRVSAYRKDNIKYNIRDNILIYRIKNAFSTDEDLGLSPESIPTEVDKKFKTILSNYTEGATPLIVLGNVTNDYIKHFEKLTDDEGEFYFMNTTGEYNNRLNPNDDFYIYWIRVSNNRWALLSELGSLALINSGNANLSDYKFPYFYKFKNNSAETIKVHYCDSNNFMYTNYTDNIKINAKFTVKFTPKLKNIDEINNIPTFTVIEKQNTFESSVENIIEYNREYQNMLETLYTGSIVNENVLAKIGETYIYTDSEGKNLNLNTLYKYNGTTLTNQNNEGKIGDGKDYKVIVNNNLYTIPYIPVTENYGANNYLQYDSNEGNTKGYLSYEGVPYYNQ